MLLLEYDDDYFIFLNCRNLFDFFSWNQFHEKFHCPSMMMLTTQDLELELELEPEKE